MGHRLRSCRGYSVSYWKAWRGGGSGVSRRGPLVRHAVDEGVRDEIEARGLKALDRNDLLRIVELCDPLKQRTAVKSLVYCVPQVEKKSSPTDRVNVFLEQAEKAAETTATPIDA